MELDASRIADKKSKGKYSSICNSTNYIDLYAWDINMKSSCMGIQINKQSKTHKCDKLYDRD